jgi:hypothetical protein
MSVMTAALILGLVVLVTWVLVVDRRRRRPKRLNQPVVDRHPPPPAHPTEQARPGSAPYREETVGRDPTVRS